MKHLFLLLTCFVFTFFSCNNDDTDTKAYLNEQATISMDESYEFLVGTFDEHSEIEILQQASNYSQSEITYNQETQQATYVYTPETDFVGMETVELFFRNVLPTTAEHYITIEIEVVE